MREMMTSDDFTDVTLVTDDKKTIKAHRNILSACSPVFKNILQMEITNNHPVIYLRGIQYTEIVSILQFYNQYFWSVEMRVLDNVFVLEGLGYHYWRIHSIYLFHDMMMDIMCTDIFIWRQVGIFLLDF